MKLTLLELLEKTFRDAFLKLAIAGPFSLGLGEATRPEFGDYQVNGIMSIAKELGLAPRVLAQQVVDQVDKGDLIEHLEVAGPGFINIKISDNFLSTRLGPELLTVKLPKSKVVVIDYSSPNLAKEMHVGHLRSTIIGDALVRINEALGNQVILRNHVGDWGTQFGMLIAYLMESFPGIKAEDNSLALEDLEGFYRQAKERFDQDASFAEKSRECVVKLQNGDAEILKLWHKFVEISLGHCQKIYDRLKTKLAPEDAFGESCYNEMLPQVVAELVEQEVAVDDRGAKCVFFSKGELAADNSDSPFIIQKQDGAYLYSTTDIAAVKDRINNLHADILLYVIDVRQALHLKQLFATVKRAKLVKKNTVLEHVAFGTMLGEDNRPFKTRSGGTVKLAELLDEAVTRAAGLIKARHQHWSVEEVNDLAEKVGIAAVKYADLAKNRISDYVFNFDQMLAFEGNTAPYLLYAYVRINSIFKKAGLVSADYLGREVKISAASERELALHLVRFADRLLTTARENYPHYLAGYSYELATLFMRFYENYPVLNAEQELRASRLALASLTAEVLRSSLQLLGIAVVDKM